MIPKNNPEKFITTYGNWWYLREFDYLPEPLEYYNKNISSEFMSCVKEGKFDLFQSLEDAKLASYEIRKERNMIPFTFDEALLIRKNV